MKQNEERYTTIIEDEAAPLYYAKIFQHPNNGNYFISIRKDAEKDCDIPLESVCEYDGANLRLRKDLSPFDRVKVSAGVEDCAEEMINFYRQVKDWQGKNDKSYLISFQIYDDLEPVQKNINYFRRMRLNMTGEVPATKAFNPDVQPALTFWQNENYETPGVYSLNDILAHEQTPPESAIIRGCSKAAGSFMNERVTDFISRTGNVYLFGD